MNVGGMTLHSFAGILDVLADKVKLAERLWGWPKYTNRWRAADVLLVDEISMVDCELLEKVSGAYKHLHHMGFNTSGCLAAELGRYCCVDLQATCM